MKKIDKKEIITSTAKSIFGAIPFGGAALDELFFEYNGRLKQNRLNRFVKILAENFTEESDINLDNIKTEDFNDLFESVLRKVVQTKSEAKLIRFKDVLLNELKKPTKQAEINELYLNLISELTEQEIEILYNHRFFTEEFEEEVNEMNRHRDNMKSLKNQMDKESIIVDESKFLKPYENVKAQFENKKSKIDKVLKYRNADFYNLNENKFMFFKQRLFSKGLLIDDRMKRIGTLPFQSMGITEFGVEFIDFIKTSEKK